MTDAGYSGTTLPRKLGVKPGSRVLVVAAPPGFDLGQDVPPDVTLHSRPGRSTYDVVLAFCPDQERLVKRFAALVERLTVAGALWIAWPKRSGPVASDLDENVVREHGLSVGLVDVKVAAVDATWSSLKFVRRVQDRG